MKRNDASRNHQQQMTALEQQQFLMEQEAAALAAEMFDHLCGCTTMRQVLGLYRNMLDILNMRPGPLNEFYPKLKSRIKSWKAQALWKKFDTRAAHRVYNKGTAAAGTKVLVIGAGPCGLRTAIEAQLLGAKVVVVEKRDRISRNNVLHLWPFVITDLRLLGAKKFYGKFCAGSIDHISIRQLQCILLKVALLLGVEVHEGVSFVRTIEPRDGCGWRAQVEPDDHAVSHFEFDVLIGADGKRNTLEGFKRKEFRGKLAIAITANFINKKTEAEAKVEEISGVAFIFNQSFFKELYQTTGIDLENIVYYKDETHYFVMTAKKHSLIDKGVIVQDYADPAELLSPANVDTNKLLDYAREAAEFSTKYQMPNLEFAVNHYGKPDVAMFDFTSMFAADNSCRVVVRKNYRLLSCLVGDSLLEPFWPTGSGCARGFLSSMDAAYTIKLFSNQQNSILACLAQRESIYRLLAQTTPENLNRDIGSYTLDPSTRYPNLNKASVMVQQVKHLLDTDDPSLLEQTHLDTTAAAAEKAGGYEVPLKRKRRTLEALDVVLLRWVKSHLKSYDWVQNLNEASEIFTQGQALCLLIHRFRPDLIDIEKVLQSSNTEAMNETAFSVLQSEFGIKRVMTGYESETLTDVDRKVWVNYLEEVCETFRGEVPHVKHPILDYSEFKQKMVTPQMTMAEFSRLRATAAANAAASPKKQPSEPREVKDNYVTARKHRKLEAAPEKRETQAPPEQSRRSRKRRTYEKFGNIEERAKRLEEIEENRLDRQNRRRMARAQQTQNFLKSMHMLQANSYGRDGSPSGDFEDYSIYLYRQTAPVFNDRVKDLERKLLYPDRERGIGSSFMKSGLDEQFSDRIKDMENRITSRNTKITDKKPKDLLRSIGKIGQDDWNVKEIEKKIELSKKTTDIGKSRERVPKWSREQFLARQNKLTGAAEGGVTDAKYKEVDDTLKAIDKKLKEGAILESAKNKVASIAGQFRQKEESEEEIPHKSPREIKRPVMKPMTLTGKDATEKCNFCKQRVYLMEKVTAENLILHRSCLKCHHCHTSLRLGNYAFDRDDPEGKFYCTQHYRLPPKEFRMPQRRPGPARQASARDDQADKAVDLIDRGQTPERIEFENSIEVFSEGEPSLEQVIDENEWTDKNFGTGSESEDDLSSSDESDSSDDSVYDDPIGSPLGAHTLQLANDWIDKRFTSMQDSDDDFYEYSSEDDEAESQTEGEELARAREIRMQEVKLMPLPKLPTDTETDAQSDSDSDSNVQLNSATEISTDSEFEQDPVTLDPPKIFIDDTHLRRPTRVQIKSGRIESQRDSRRDSYTGLKSTQPAPHFKPLVEVDPSIKLCLANRPTPLQNPRPGDYLLSKTASTEGIASKKSLELKKRYLLGADTNLSGVLKSESASALDSKFKSFHSNISECQKLLNPANDISPAMKNFLSKSTGLRPMEMNKNEKNAADVEEKENLNKKMEEEKKPIEIIDLTLDSPVKDRSLVETKVLFSVPTSDDNENVVPDILSNINEDNNDEKKEEVLEETSIEVPEWSPVAKKPSLQSSEIESDSLSESSTSSCGEIPHFILNETAQVTPSDTFVKPTFEIQNEAGDVMQMDSLMFVNGEYIGYPDEPEEVPAELPSTLPSEPPKILKFDMGNENKIDTLKNLPLKIESQIEKPTTLELKTTVGMATAGQDDDKTPTAFTPGDDRTPRNASDTETEVTGQVLTETELSDWTADDVVSENFVVESLPRTRKHKRKRNVPLASLDPVTPQLEQKGILNNLAIFDDLEFADTGSEDSCLDKVVSKNGGNGALDEKRWGQGYIEFVPNTAASHNPPSYNCKSDSAYGSSPKLSLSELKTSASGVSYIEQGASVLRKPATFSSLSSYESESLRNTASVDPPDSLVTAASGEMEEDSLVMITSTETVGTTTEESEALTVVTSPLESLPLQTQTDEEKTFAEDAKEEAIPSKPELSICEYVNQLQARISEISGASARKGSKEEAKIFTEQLTEPPTLSKKIEMISKERTKQKDIIHDLVMDKLQQKKKLNAEKRLSRSRNRSTALSALTNAPRVEPEFKTPYTVRQVALKDFETPKTVPKVSKFASFSYTDRLREEARARARLLSNEDLGLSPEEKIQQLRKKYNLTPRGRPETLQTSKSVSDILMCQQQSQKPEPKKLDYREIYKPEFTSDSALHTKTQEETRTVEDVDPKKKKLREKRERRRSLIQTVSDFFHKRKDERAGSSSKDRETVFSRFRLSPKKKDLEVLEKSKVDEAEENLRYERSKSDNVLNLPSYESDEEAPLSPVALLPSQFASDSFDDENETRNELKRIKAITKASRQAELKRLRVAQEIEREREEIEVKVRDLELRGVEIEKVLRGEDGKLEGNASPSDQELLKELFEIWRQITKLKKHDEELVIRQKELQLEHRHAQLKEQLELRLSCNKLDKSSSDVAAEGAILNEMLDIVAKRASLRPQQSSETTTSIGDLNASTTSSNA